MAPHDLETLRRKIIRLEGARRRSNEGMVSSGCGPLDELLAEGGLRRGTLTEWLAVGEGTGSSTLALLAAREACRGGGTLVVLDCFREFYPPPAVRLGIRWEQLIVVRASGTADNLWALDQSLRCRGVAAVLAWAEKLEGRVFRRLQLAAEEGGGLGLLIRPERARYDPSWAEVRVFVEPLPPGRLPEGHCHRRTSPHRDGGALGTGTNFLQPARSAKRRLRIHLLRCRGGTEGRSVDVEIDHETYTVHLVASWAEPARGAGGVGRALRSL